MITPDFVRTMARYNRWQNRSIYGAAGTLADAQRKANRGAFFGSIHGTLNHLLLADSVWIGRFEGKPFAFTSLDQELYSSFDELRAQRTQLDERIRRWADGLTDAALEAKLPFTSAITKQSHTPTLWKIVAHFFNHQTHHRGQLTALLSQAHVDYGVTDLFLLPGALDD